jgi:hypothetical protein
MIGVVRAAQNKQLQLLADAKIGTTAGAQSYTLPSGTRYIDIELYGGGGGGGAGVTISGGRATTRYGGFGGGGGGYVRHGFTGAFGSDVLNFTTGSGGTGINLAVGASGGNTSLTNITRSENTVITFSGIVAYGGFGGRISANFQSSTGGQALNGNISNRPGLSGGFVSGDPTAVNGTIGGHGGHSDENVANAIVNNNGGAGGLHATNTRAGIGGNALTGLVGAGGGFLIIPALVMLSKLPMKQAVGTSLLIIAAKSLIGFTGDIGNGTMNWTLLLTVTTLAIAGIFIGEIGRASCRERVSHQV